MNPGPDHHVHNAELRMLTCSSQRAERQGLLGRGAWITLGGLGQTYRPSAGRDASLIQFLPGLSVRNRPCRPRTHDANSLESSHDLGARPEQPCSEVGFTSLRGESGSPQADRRWEWSEFS